MPHTLVRRALTALAFGALALATVASGAMVAAAAEPASTTEATATLRELTDEQRSTLALTPLQQNAALQDIAQQRAEQLADSGELTHDPHISQDLPVGWSTWGENIATATGTDLTRLHDAWLHSPRHAANQVSEDYTDIGVGYARASDGTAYAVELFAAYVAPPEVATVAESFPGVALTTALSPASAASIDALAASPVRAPVVIIIAGALLTLLFAATSIGLFVWASRRRQQPPPQP